MPRVTQETLNRLDAVLNILLQPEILSKCTLCRETLTHVVKKAEIESGAGTRTVSNAIAEKINETALPQDKVSGGAIQERVKRHEGFYDSIFTNHENNPQFRTSFTGENEWYTPEKYIESVRRVMGSIDLDPATSDFAQLTIKAKTFFTLETDGLENEWFGNVWLNPPYSRNEISQFAAKIINEIKAGNIKQAIILTNNYTDTSWFHDMEKIFPLICFTYGRVNFVNKKGETARPTQGSAFFYIGENEKKFIMEFDQYGFIRKRV